VVADVCAELRARVEAALAAGVAEDRIIVDPGLGFAKTAEHKLAAVCAPRCRRWALGYPVLFASEP